VKIDLSGLDLARLARRIDADYGLGVAGLTFVPAGEEAYGFVAAGPAGARWFVRAQRRGGGLEAVYAAIAALHARCGLRGVVAPLPTRRGSFTGRQRGFTIAVFPFVDGASPYPAGLTESGTGRAADLIAALHITARACPVPLPSQETFANPFAAPIRRALQAAATLGPTANYYQRRAARLLLAQQADVMATLATMRRLRAAARRLDLAWGPTHGDPNLANFLVDDGGELHLLDWGELALGPPERDLNHFRGERFEIFLRRYLERAGPLRLHPELFEFYLYRWAAQEIADYSTRIFFRNVDPREDEHAWRELQPYLPVPHAEIRAELAEVQRVLRRLGTD
jgi:spectinomycin phosphotransferase